jgi:hypothetical protein
MSMDETQTSLWHIAMENRIDAIEDGLNWLNDAGSNVG